RFLVSGENEQAILDDRAADRKADVLLVIGRRAEVAVDTAEAVAAQAVAGVLIKNVALPLIGARLRNRVDVTDRETAVGHVERRQLDSDLLDRVVGERHADCRRIAILIQPETVVLAYSVQGNAVEAGMFAAAVDGEAVVLVVEVD